MEALKLAIQNSITTGFVDDSFESLIEYRPSILTNEPSLKENVLSVLLEELRNCDSFFLSVAFVTTGGVSSLFGTLLDLESQGIRGKVLVSDYLNFTQPEALKKLRKLKNVELKITRDIDFHSKGFLFTHKQHYTIIIGSSNLTHGALTKNKEWNLKVTAHRDSELFKNTIKEFEGVFKLAQEVTDVFLEKYTFVYNSEKKLRDGLKKALLEDVSKEIVPNQMQVQAIENLNCLRANGQKRALIVSATGTGKTFLSAFDVKQFNPKKLLFLVHRKNIALKALESFEQILGNGKKLGFYSGSTKIDCDYLFSTIQTFSRDEHLNKFGAIDFDYIVIDETHRAGASSYQKILKYFNPKFLLGMTATPERNDEMDVFAMFDFNIASEIRLQDALSNDMLAPFHYYGISEIEINGEIIGDNTNINDLNRAERVDHIIEKINLFGTDDGIIRGLVFCSRKEECNYLSEQFNNKGFRTIALTGESKEDDRSRAIDLLETDDLEIKLDYIFTVDIFNEGIDIPRVNQIIMLRPTQSSIIFVQQLGRGLRKREGKSYVTVIDFIGNYQNNFLVPIALFGDKTFSKDNLRKLVNRPEKAIVGASTIYFSRVIKERIFHSIDNSKLQEKHKLKTEFKVLKNKIGRIPMMVDFLKYGERDPFHYIKSFNSYYEFLSIMNENIPVVSKSILDLLKFLSNEVLNPVRLLDVHLFKTLLEKTKVSLEEYKEIYFLEFGHIVDNETINHAIYLVNGLFHTIKENQKMVKIGLNKKYELIKNDGNYLVIGESLKSLMENEFLIESLFDICEYSIETLLSLGKESIKNDFVINARYSRKDVFRILRWKENPNAQNVGGYMISDNKKDCAIFVNYHKAEDISSSTKYLDRFVSRKEFFWMSKNNRTLQSSDVKQIISSKETKMRLPLFVKKSNSEGIEFYYLGDMQYVDETACNTQIIGENKKFIPVVEMKFILNKPVDNDMYDYIVNSL